MRTRQPRRQVHVQRRPRLISFVYRDMDVGYDENDTRSSEVYLFFFSQFYISTCIYKHIDLFRLLLDDMTWEIACHCRRTVVCLNGKHLLSTGLLPHAKTPWGPPAIHLCFAVPPPPFSPIAGTLPLANPGKPCCRPLCCGTAAARCRLRPTSRPGPDPDSGPRRGTRTAAGA